MRTIGILTLSLALCVAAPFAKKAAAAGRGLHYDHFPPCNGGGGAPEPASLLLLGLGAGVVGLKKFKNRKANKNIDL